MITYFRSINDTSEPFYKDVSMAIDRIRNGSSKDKVMDVRNSSNKEERNEKKKKLPAICFSGTFSRRSDNAIIEHSGFICIDFDGFKNEQDLYNKREELMADKYSYCVFTSPSGDGINGYLVKYVSGVILIISPFSFLKTTKISCPSN